MRLGSDMSDLFTLSAPSSHAEGLGKDWIRYKTITHHPRHDGSPKPSVVVGWLATYPTSGVEGWYLLVKSRVQELSAAGAWPTPAELFEHKGHAGPFADEDAALAALRIML